MNHLPGPATHLEEVVGDDGEAPGVVRLVLDVWVVGENIGEHVKEEVQRVLIQEVDLVQRVKGEVDVGASLWGGAGKGLSVAKQNKCLHKSYIHRWLFLGVSTDLQTLLTHA